jgi:hypothetical protein
MERSNPVYFEVRDIEVSKEDVESLPIKVLRYNIKNRDVGFEVKSHHEVLLMEF